MNKIEEMRGLYSNNPLEGLESSNSLISSKKEEMNMMMEKKKSEVEERAQQMRSIGKRLFYIDNFFDENVDGRNIIAGTEGTFYFRKKDIPTFMLSNIEGAIVEQTALGSKSCRYGQQLFINVVSEKESLENKYADKEQVIIIEDKQVLIDIVRFLSAKDYMIEVDGNQIIPLSDGKKIATEVELFLSKVNNSKNLETVKEVYPYMDLIDGDTLI